MMNSNGIGMVIGCALCALSPSQGLAAAQFVPPAEPGPGVPMEVTSYHVPVVRNEFVTIFRVDIPPGRSSGYHIHDRDQVCTVVADYPPEAYSQPLGGPPGKPRQAVTTQASMSTRRGKSPATPAGYSWRTLSKGRASVTSIPSSSTSSL
jgi:hypothetical protein